MGPIWVLYGQKSLYGAHVRPEWDKCPDSANMGPIYTCLLGKSDVVVFFVFFCLCKVISI